MSTTTLERTCYTGVDERQKSSQPEKVVGVIDSLLHRVDELPDDEVERRFTLLMTGATDRLQLHKFAGEGRIEEYCDTIPGANELLDRIREEAVVVLEHNGNLTSEDDIPLVNNLGLAADLTEDKEILEKTLDAMQDTVDYSLDYSLADLKRALELARERDMLFYNAYRDIQNGKHALAIAAKSTPMSQRPDFNDDDPLAMWLSKREVEMPRHHSWEQTKEALAFRALSQADVSVV